MSGDTTTALENFSNVTCSEESNEVRHTSTVSIGSNQKGKNKGKLQKGQKKVKHQVRQKKVELCMPRKRKKKEELFTSQKRQKKEALQKGQKKEKRQRGNKKVKLQNWKKKLELRNRPEKEKPVSMPQNTTVSESTMIRVSQILENFSISQDEVYEFDAKLSPEECVAVYKLSRKMGFKIIQSGKQKISVHKIIRKVSTTTELESLSHFTFSEESKQLLGGLLTHYPPGDEEFMGEMIGINTDTTYKTKQRGDDFFGRPCMSKADIAMKLEELAARMKNPSDLKPIFEKRSQLPIASFKDIITSTVDSHQVVLISGETGCGKTTQVPQFILDHMWGKGEVCKIVCTQPRRISAVSVSERISCERGEAIGNNVGYKIRLESEGGRQSSIVLCTTGVLLKVLVSRGYSQLKTRSVKGDISGITHIIMDEIHERDRFSDIMLAILREMLPSYPHLRLILMSATVDAERFCHYFGNCPVIHVPGFTYPVKNFFLEDVLSILKREDNHHDKNYKLSREEKLALDEAINLAWTNDEWYPLLELVNSEWGSKVFNYQHSLTGFTPLMVAAGNGKVGEVSMLLSLGADFHLQAKDGKTALEIAEMKNQQVAAEMLRKHMVNDFSDIQGKNLVNEYLATVNPEFVDVVLVEKLIKQICIDSKDGGILVFFPGWDEINKTRLKLLASPFFKDTERFMIISLHSRVPSLEQKKVFMCPPPGCRKIVLSTNIAETAVTIDDVVYVIDTGRMKEKSYDPYNNVLTLQSSWVSKANAKQRQGRAGRCRPGICYHLYSKVRAASLPDFRVPEIKRMPVEEICLQIKILDPRCRIEEFLSKTLDPPVFESIQNGIAVLQELGALTFDQELTQLGEKLGSLPVHPSTSRMLLLAILTKCLDPALTLACASESKDPFTLPFSPEEKTRAAAAKSELASLYGGRGDQLALVAAFECWQNAKSMGLEEKFCSQYFVSRGTMQRISSMRMKLAAELFRKGLIHDDVSSYCLNNHDPGLLHAVLVAGMYPRVGLVACSANDSRKRAIIETESGAKVRMSFSSTNFGFSPKKNSNRPLVVYDEITRGDWGMTIRGCTVVGALPLLLLSKGIAVAPAKRSKKGCKDDHFMSSPDNKIRVIIDQWLCFESTALDISQIYYLRERLSAAMAYKVIHSTDVLPPVLAATVDALSCVLSCDDIPATPQASDVAGAPAVTLNETNLSKPAVGTEQAGENPKGSGTELKNLDECQTNPYPKVTISGSVVNENPSDDQTSHNNTMNMACSIPAEYVGISGSGANEIPNDDQTSHNTPMNMACSIPAEHVGKNPEGSRRKLIHRGNMSFYVIGMSALKGLDNPSDPNVAIGSVCSMPAMQTAPSVVESHTTLINQDTNGRADVPCSEVGISAPSCTENPSDPTNQDVVKVLLKI